MTGPFRLQTLLEVAEHRLDAATVELQVMQMRCRRLREQLGTQEARLEHERAALASALSQGLHAGRLRDALRYIDRLAAAAKQHEQALAEAEREWAGAMMRWRDLRHARQGLDALRRRYLGAARAAELRREQSQQDEFAAQIRHESPLRTGDGLPT